MLKSLSVLLLMLCLTFPAYAQSMAPEKLRQSTVHIAIGTGFILEASSGNHYLISNWHVCNAGSWKGKMRANFEGGALVEGSITKLNPTSDLCATKVSKGHAALKLAKSLARGEQVYTRGYPYGVLSETTGRYVKRASWDYVFPIEEVGECFEGSQPVMTGKGIIEGCKAHYTDNITDMYSRPGSSGSPVVNADGDLVGVMSSWDSTRDAGGMVPFEQVQEFMQGL